MQIRKLCGIILSMNPPSAALLEQLAVWPTSASDGPATEHDPGEWGCPGIGFGGDGVGVFERDEVGVALSESYAEVFVRRR